MSAGLAYSIPVNNEDSFKGYSRESNAAAIQYSDIAIHYYEPVSRQNNPTHKFYNLISKWKNETKYSSSITEMVMNPTYQQIIGIGREVVPLLLRELSINPDHWFWALKAITGADPIQEEQRGKVDAMAEAWLSWGKENGFIAS